MVIPRSMNPFAKMTFALRIMLSLALLAAAPVRAEEGKVERGTPFLWEISGNGLSEPSFLFGTLHVGDERVTRLHPLTERAFAKARVVMTEVPMDSASQLAAVALVMRGDGKTLDESIGEEIAERLDEELALINPALDSKPFQPLATWSVATMFPILPDQLAGREALDLILWNKAESDGKRTGALETIESQLGIFSAMTEEEQVVMLKETLEGLMEARAEGRDAMEVLKLAYISGDTGKLQTEMDRGFEELAQGKDKELAKAFLKRLFTDRDASMAKTIDHALKEEPGVVHFFAAGAGHFTSETSIRSHLEEAGYAIRRVTE